MTTEELNTIVEAVVAELEKNGVDFDNEVKKAQDTDLVFVIRETDSGYGGFKVTWKGLLDIITAKATQAKTDAVNAKDIAQQILTQVQNKGSEITNFVATSKTEIETQKDESVNAVKSVYQTDLDELKGDLDTERNERIEGDTALSTRLQKVEVASSVNRYEIDNLKAKAEGKLYRTETVEAEAYALDVPSSVAPYAELQKIGGKSVVWNQLFNFVNYNKTSDNITINVSNNRIKIIGTALQDNYFWIYFQFSVKSGHKYICLKNIIKGDSSSFLIQGYSTNQVFEANTSTVNIGYSYKSGVTYDSEYIVSLIDLTQMFGLGNEPTFEECQKIFSEDYYPYNAGEIKSFPVQRVKSIGKNLLIPSTSPSKEENGVTWTNNGDGTISVSGIATNYTDYVLCDFQKIGDLINNRIITFSYGEVNNLAIEGIAFYDKNKNIIFRTIDNRIDLSGFNNIVYIRIIVKRSQNNKEIKGTIKAQLEIGPVATDYSPYKEPTVYDVTSLTEGLKSTFTVKDEWQNGKITRNVGERAYTEGDESDSTLLTDRTTTYYPLETPTVEEVPEIDNYLPVEGGGTLTFESDDAVHMPVLSTDRFVVDLTSTTEETT